MLTLSRFTFSFSSCVHLVYTLNVREISELETKRHQLNLVEQQRHSRHSTSSLQCFPYFKSKNIKNFFSIFCQVVFVKHSFLHVLLYTLNVSKRLRNLVDFFTFKWSIKQQIFFFNFPLNGKTFIVDSKWNIGNSMYFLQINHVQYVEEPFNQSCVQILLLIITNRIVLQLLDFRLAKVKYSIRCWSKRIIKQHEIAWPIFCYRFYFNIFAANYSRMSTRKCLFDVAPCV